MYLVFFFYRDWHIYLNCFGIIILRLYVTGHQALDTGVCCLQVPSRFIVCQRYITRIPRNAPDCLGGCRYRITKINLRICRCCYVNRVCTYQVHRKHIFSLLIISISFLTHSLTHHFETVPNSKTLQTTTEVWLLKDLKI